MPHVLHKPNNRHRPTDRFAMNESSPYRQAGLAFGGKFAILGGL
jgi:hypothetical protein